MLLISGDAYCIAIIHHRREVFMRMLKTCQHFEFTHTVDPQMVTFLLMRGKL
jgi:hypothetical protein